MPKRKRSDENSDYEMYQELRKLKKKLRRLTRRKRKHSNEKCSVSRNATPSQSNIQDRETIENDMSWLSDTDSEAMEHGIHVAQSPTPEAQTLPAPPSLESVVTYSCDTAVQTHETAADDATSPAPEKLDSVLPASLPPEPELDSIALEILGEDPYIEIKYGKNIQKDVAVRFKHTAVTGLSKESRKEFTAKYLTPANCTLIDPPALNPEIKAAASELVIKRDKAIEFKQKQLAVAISCVSGSISHLLTARDKNTELLKMLMDAGRLLCDCQHTDSNTRRSFMLSTLKPDMKSQLQNTKIDKFSFGENLQETIKSAKVINKSGNELKSNSAPRPQQTQARRPTQSAQSKNLNWKSPRTREPAQAPGPSASYRPPPPPPAPPSRQHGASYKTSQNRSANYRR